MSIFPKLVRSNTVRVWAVNNRKREERQQQGAFSVSPITVRVRGKEWYNVKPRKIETLAKSSKSGLQVDSIWQTHNDSC